MKALRVESLINYLQDSGERSSCIGFCALQGSEEFIAQMKKAQAEYAELTGQTVGVRTVAMPQQQGSARIFNIDGTPADENSRGIVIDEGQKRIQR